MIDVEHTDGQWRESSSDYSVSVNAEAAGTMEEIRTLVSSNAEAGVTMEEK